MGIRLEKDWQPLEPGVVDALPGQLGVYQIADAEGRVLFIGCAGGRSRFGLRGELQRECEHRRGQGARFRVEVNVQYTTRHQELLMLHSADHGSLPPENEPSGRLGTLHPD